MVFCIKSKNGHCKVITKLQVDTKFSLTQSRLCSFFQDKSVYKSFVDGNLLRSMNIIGPYLVLRIYLDAFATNSPIGSSSMNHKVMGMYFAAIDDIKVRFSYLIFYIHKAQ